MLKIAMLDGERLSLDLFAGAFKSAFLQRGEQTEVFAFSSPKVFLSTLSDTQYDLVCVALEMDEMGGIEVAEKLREVDSHVPLVFVSSRQDPVFACFDFHPIGIIRKGNFLDDAIAFVDHYLNVVLPKRRSKNTLMVKVHGDTTFIDIENINYIEGSHNYQTFYFRDGSPCVKVRQLISDLERRLFDYGFIRVHKGFLVNANEMYRMATAEIVMKNGERIPLSQKRRDAVLERYLELNKDTLMVG